MRRPSLLPSFVINSNLLLGERIDWPSSFPRLYLGRVSAALGMNRIEQCSGSEGRRRDNNGRDEEKGTLVFSLCIHSDFVIFLCKGRVHLIL